MKYLLLIYGDEQAWTEAERAERDFHSWMGQLLR
jgi:hypothetical protein